MTPDLRRREATEADATVIVGWFPTRRDAVWWGGPTVSDPLTAEWLVAQFAGGAFWVWTDRDNVIQAMAGLEAMSDGTAYLNRFGIAPAMRGKGQPAPAKPWDGAEGLEWEVPSPAPFHTFENPPKLAESATRVIG